MTQILLPSPVGLHNGRLWPTKVHSIDSVGRELCHLRESSRHLRLLHDDLFSKVDQYHVEKQIKSFAKCGLQYDKQVEITRETNHVVVQKQDAKLCTRTQHVSSSSSEMARRSTRHIGNTDDWVDHILSNNLPSPVDVHKEICSTSCSQDMQSSIVTPNIQSKKSVYKGRFKTLGKKSLECKSTDLKCRRKSARQALLREEMESKMKQSIKQDSKEDVVDLFPDKVVSVPTWRVIQVHKRYVIEGTENITDEAYHKRHHRLEADEKRRKRWDLQRQRELSAYESARLTYGDSANTVPSSPASSDSIDIAYVEVVDDESETAVEHSLQNLRHTDYLQESNAKNPRLSSNRMSANRITHRKRNGKRSRRG